MPNDYKRREFLKLAGCAASVYTLTGFSHAKPRHPNVIFLFADQHRASAMGCYGDPNGRTPNLDKLAEQGVRMEAAYSNTPVCSPFRACLMTGCYSHHHGMMTNNANFLPTGPLLAQTFKEAGYTTAYVGKWHLEFPSHELQFPGQYPHAHKKYVPPQRRMGYDWWRMADIHHNHFAYSFFIDDAQQPTAPQKGWQPAGYIDMAMEFITSHKTDKPFFLTVSFVPPHTPYTAPEPYRQRYQDTALELLPNVPKGKAEQFARDNLPDYYGMIEALDTDIGRLLSLVDDMGLSENTIVVYTSDHGDQLGSHGYKVKRWPHDESSRIPFILRYPANIRAGQVVTTPFSAIDMFPTLAGLCELEVPPAIDGVDYSAHLRHQSTPPRDYVFLQMHYGYVPWPGWRALRTRKYLYAETKLGP